MTTDPDIPLRVAVSTYILGNPSGSNRGSVASVPRFEQVRVTVRQSDTPKDDVLWLNDLGGFDNLLGNRMLAVLLVEPRGHEACLPVAENLPDLALGACHGHPCDPKNLSLGSCAAVEALLFLNWPRASSANATLLFYRSLFGSHGGR
jgi:hypothetical protein